jgi:hypothetical protein
VGAAALGRWGAGSALLALTLLGPGPVTAQSNRWPLVDEAWRDPQLVLARMEVMRAAASRDTSALKATLDPEFMWSFGGGSSSEFFATLRSDPSLWALMVEVFALGGHFGSGDSDFEAPSYWQHMPCSVEQPPGGADSLATPAGPRFSCAGEDYSLLVVLGTDVRVRQSPGGTPIAAVSLGIVMGHPTLEEARTPNGERWTAVILPDHTVGWIASRLLRYPTSWRGGFRRGVDGRWRLRYFIAGD